MPKHLLTLLLAGLPVLSGCIVTNERAGELVTESRDVDLGSVEMVRVEVRMSVGELKLGSGAKKLMQGEFRYNVPDWKPDIRYDATGFRGRLTVQQRSALRSIGPTDATNRWDIRLQGGVPMDLHVSLGAGEGRMDVGGLALRNLEVRLGAGELQLDLRGDWKKDADVQIRGGVGEATVRLPRNVGIRAEASGGIGEINVRGLQRRGRTWVNELYERAPVTMRVDVRGGVGQINLLAEE